MVNKTAFVEAGALGRSATWRGQNTAHDFCLPGFTQLYPGCGITFTRNVFLFHTGRVCAGLPVATQHDADFPIRQQTTEYPNAPGRWIYYYAMSESIHDFSYVHYATFFRQRHITAPDAPPPGNPPEADTPRTNCLLI
ncbi:hypothetical protein [Desulfovibrio sp. 86]|uniref:hypothetical protein n=1 Tax=Desulfovibrio sp. 86 TaxID=2666132 RepID=UPI0015D191D6|nr:hypothetical protein [Desulfovibrio sp. 86]